MKRATIQVANSNSYLEYEYRGGDTVEIVDILATERRCGIGTAMIKQLEMDLKSSNVVYNIYALTRRENEPAKKFYESCGFRLVSWVPDLYRNGSGDAVVYVKQGTDQ